MNTLGQWSFTKTIINLFIFLQRFSHFHKFYLPSISSVRLPNTKKSNIYSKIPNKNKYTSDILQLIPFLKCKRTYKNELYFNVNLFQTSTYIAIT